VRAKPTIQSEARQEEMINSNVGDNAYNPYDEHQASLAAPFDDAQEEEGWGGTTEPAPTRRSVQSLFMPHDYRERLQFQNALLLRSLPRDDERLKEVRGVGEKGLQR
jgi:hypothetical protein